MNFFRKLFASPFVAVFWLVVVAVLSLLPGDDIPRWDIPYLDKYVHVMMYAGISFLWGNVFGFRFRPRKLLQKLTLLLLASLSYGLLMEILQQTIAVHRAFDWLDMAANAAGSITGILFALI